MFWYSKRTKTDSGAGKMYAGKCLHPNQSLRGIFVTRRCDLSYKPECLSRVPFYVLEQYQHTNQQCCFAINIQSTNFFLSTKVDFNYQRKKLLTLNFKYFRTQAIQ